jgi:hypothetical protein
MELIWPKLPLVELPTTFVDSILVPFILINGTHCLCAHLLKKKLLTLVVVLIRLFLSKGPNEVSPFPHLKKGTESILRNVLVLTKDKTMDNVKNCDSHTRVGFSVV